MGSDHKDLHGTHLAENIPTFYQPRLAWQIACASMYNTPYTKHLTQQTHVLSTVLHLLTSMLTEDIFVFHE